MDVIRTVSASLQACLDEDLDRLARDCQVVLRERVFPGQSLLLMVVTNCSAEELSWKAVVVLYRAR